jgi:hypothetical protein
VAHPRYTAYYMVLHVSMRSISQWMQRSTFTHTLWRTIVAFEHAKYHVMYADGVCGARVWAVAVPTRRTGPRRRPGAGRPLNRTPATGRRSECVALSSGLSWALCATASRLQLGPSPRVPSGRSSDVEMPRFGRFLRCGVRYKVTRANSLLVQRTQGREVPARFLSTDSCCP